MFNEGCTKQKMKGQKMSEPRKAEQLVRLFPHDKWALDHLAAIMGATPEEAARVVIQRMLYDTHPGVFYKWAREYLGSPDAQAAYAEIMDACGGLAASRQPEKVSLKVAAGTALWADEIAQGQGYDSFVGMIADAERQGMTFRVVAD